MNRSLTGLRRVAVESLAVIAVLILGGNVAPADPLDPLAFTSLGTFNPASSVSIDTSALTMSGGITGVLSGGIAVFDFDNITLTAGLTISVVGSNPLALLSRQNASTAGTILLGAAGAAGAGTAGGFSPGLPGLGVAGGGLGGLANPSVCFLDCEFGQAGVGGGGKGGDAGVSDAVRTGILYGGGGGGGGGAIEIGAIGTLDIQGHISARGGAGGAGGARCNDCAAASGGVWIGSQGGDGGGGGSLFLHANTISLLSSALLDVSGGASGASGCEAITPGTMFPIVHCDGPGTAGAVGHITMQPSPVSEPTTFGFLASAFAALAGMAWRARRRM